MRGYHVTVNHDNGRVREEFYLLHDVAFGLADWPASYVVLDAFAAILRAHLFRLHLFDIDITHGTVIAIAHQCCDFGYGNLVLQYGTGVSR